MTRARLELLAAALAGLVFSLGLGLAGMTQPAKVRGFLDFFGDWDPALALVMGGAVAVTLLGFRRVLRRNTPLVARRFVVPDARAVDVRLLLGAALFGVGWGLSGFCPAPALTSLATGLPAVAVFVGAMLAGMGLHALTVRARTRTVRPQRQTGSEEPC